MSLVLSGIPFYRRLSLIWEKLPSSSFVGGVLVVDLVVDISFLGPLVVESTVLLLGAAGMATKIELAKWVLLALQYRLPPLFEVSCPEG